MFILYTQSILTLLYPPWCTSVNLSIGQGKLLCIYLVRFVKRNVSFSNAHKYPLLNRLNIGSAWIDTNPIQVTLHENSSTKLKACNLQIIYWFIKRHMELGKQYKQPFSQFPAQPRIVMLKVLRYVSSSGLDPMYLPIGAFFWG